MQSTTVRSASSLALSCPKHHNALRVRPCIARRPSQGLSLVNSTRFLHRLQASAEFNEEDAAMDAAMDSGEEVVEEVVAEEESEKAEEVLAEAPAARAEPVEAQGGNERFSLNFLWLERNIGVAVDHCYGKGQKSPLTEYYFWPRTDAWEELKASLEGKPWVGERDKVLLLNQTTEVINFWQDEETKHTMADARVAFANCKFDGH